MQYMSDLKKLIIKSYNLNNNCNFVYVMYSKEVMYKYENNFWRYLEELYSQSKVVIDRPKGSVHPRYPQIVYQLDYGYLDGTKSENRFHFSLDFLSSGILIVVFVDCQGTITRHFSNHIGVIASIHHLRDKRATSRIPSNILFYAKYFTSFCQSLRQTG